MSVPPRTGRLLLVDDDAMQRKILSRHLEREGYQVITATDGEQALQVLGREEVDCVLLDVEMPGMDGFTTLLALKETPALRAIPVIMVSAVEGMDMVIKCIEAGAMDFLPKPCDVVLLRARVRSSLAQKALHDAQVRHLRDIEGERQRSDALLKNILPDAIAARLKTSSGVIAESFDSVTVMFADIVGFTTYAASVKAEEVVVSLNEVFTCLDGLADKHQLEKIKTIGDAYMVVGGLPLPTADHARRVAEMALEVPGKIREVAQGRFDVRIGIHTGPVVAGVIGRRKFSYDLWGDTVNVASRMEHHGQAGVVTVSEATRAALGDAFRVGRRSEVEVKGKGMMTLYTLEGRA